MSRHPKRGAHRERGECVAWGERGQATLEYALVLLAFMAMVVALCALWEASQRGVLLRTAQSSSGHRMDGGISVGLLQDLGAY